MKIFFKWKKKLPNYAQVSKGSVNFFQDIIRVLLYVHGISTGYLIRFCHEKLDSSK